MNKILNSKLGLSAVAVVSAFVPGTAHALSTGPTSTGNNFSNVAHNIAASLEDVPGLIASISYMLGLLMAVMGVLKIKDHVDNPTQTPMKDGAIRIIAGGALFSLPMMFEAMSNTIGTTDAIVEPATLKAATLNVS